jgi:hypothetical protein
MPSRWETEKANYLFEFRANSVAMWKEKAQSLKVASEKVYINLAEISKVIEHGVNIGKSTDESSYFLASGLNSLWMLSVGYALEGLIKALILLTVPSTVDIIVIDKKGNKRLNISQLFGEGGNSHNLIYLLKKKVDVMYRPEFTDEETLFMAKMTSYTIWRGKYPIPLGATSLTYSGQGIEKALIEKIMDRSQEYPEYVRVKNDKDKNAFDIIFTKVLDKVSDAEK